MFNKQTWQKKFFFNELKKIILLTLRIFCFFESSLNIRNSIIFIKRACSLNINKDENLYASSIHTILKLTTYEKTETILYSINCWNFNSN